MRLMNLAAVIALTLASPSDAQTVMDGSGGDLPKETLAKALTAVSDQLRDPEATRFRRLRAGSNTAMPAICGEANGKNAIGAYAGYQTFIFYAGPGVANLYPDDAKDERDGHLREVGCL